MTAPLAKVDALQAARIAPWVELLSPKAPAGAGPAQAVLNAPRVDNDVLLPQGAALRPQGAAAGEPRSEGVAASVRPSSSTELSAAARVILDLLSEHADKNAGPVRGQHPLWPAAQRAPSAAVLASALSQQVSDSGLFYESHLAQFAAGARSLAQMQREPQAGLARAAAEAARTTAQEDGAPAIPQLPRQPAGELVSVAVAQASAPTMPALLPAAPVTAAPMTNTQQGPEAAHADPANPTELQDDAAEMPQRVAHGAPALAPAPAANAALARYADSAQMADRTPAFAAASDLPAVNAVHPQAAPLVHQQLDLLASAMFRWSGEAWPGVAMEWSVQEEGARAHGEPEQTAAPQWSTALTLQLPRLGRVDLRMQLDGNSVRAQLAAPQADALMQLRVHRSTLSQRMAAAGFELRALQLDPELAA
ncbi:flagellar hook-length control protein FliK [Variovorax sp. OV329]|uniref:flagellar hook-length control protein FliK n=1 Tax=Variovorax sp. OV329 TaxID=1882825 RepID=UPI0008F09C43|nr:flagellar hook-length control protein FliK [Variovorax sp. OV329]SFM65379.1 hook-length control protein FliK [Variovorax sp. OV329]